MDDFSFTQEFNHIAYIRVVGKTKYVVVGHAGFLLRRKVFVQVGYDISLDGKADAENGKPDAAVG
jgi:hypothetical protein